MVPNRCRPFSLCIIALGLFAARPVHAARARALQEPAASQSATLAFEEPVSGPRRTLTFNPLGMLVGAAELQYEQAISPSVSFFGGPQVRWLKAADLAEGHGFGATAGLRYFVSGLAPAGFFVSPSVDVGYARLRVTNRASAGLVTGVGGMLGYTWLVETVAFSVGGGLQYSRIEGDALDKARESVLPTLRFAVGPAF